MFTDTQNFVAGRTLVEPFNYGWFHRTSDILLAFALIIIFLPFILIIAGILFFSGGPVFFCQNRLGLHGQTFAIYKFRTMATNASEILEQLLTSDESIQTSWKAESKIKNDPRVTKVGKFLRKTSLDELPQLFNILLGDMSLVGPRPIEPHEIEKYGRYAKHYFIQRPGLTGLWQVSGRSDTSYQRRVALDAYYSRNRCVKLDCKIIIKTAVVVVTRNGAY